MENSPTDGCGPQFKEKKKFRIFLRLSGTAVSSAQGAPLL